MKPVNSAFLISLKNIFIFFPRNVTESFQIIIGTNVPFRFSSKGSSTRLMPAFLYHHSTTQRSPTIQDVTTILYTFNQTIMCQTVRHRHRQQKIINLKICAPGHRNAMSFSVASCVVTKQASCRLQTFLDSQNVP